jgi:hypothetical protein
MKASLTIEFRGKLIALPVDIDYHRQDEQVDLLSVRVSGTDILGLLDRTEILALRASVLTREFAIRGRQRLPEHVREFAKEVQEETLAFSEAQKGARHVR